MARTETILGGADSAGSGNLVLDESTLLIYVNALSSDRQSLA